MALSFENLRNLSSFGAGILMSAIMTGVGRVDPLGLMVYGMVITGGLLFVVPLWAALGRLAEARVTSVTRAGRPVE